MRKLALVLLVAPLSAFAAAINVTVDLTSNVHPFSQQIFGVASWDTTNAPQMGYTVNRWGGNAVTRYNFQTDSSNHASDYLFLNEPNGDGVGLPNNSSADQFVAASIAKSAAPLITMPTIGYVAKSRAKDPGFSIAKYGAQTANECTVNNYQGCNADAGNGKCTSGAHCSGGFIVGNDPLDTSIVAPSSFDVQWITHLQSVFGMAASGGVKIFALDNEVMLWNSTHRDAHPIAATYDEIWGRTVDYALAIKVQEPNALVTGPVTWGYCDLFTSAADGCIRGTDRTAHATQNGPPDGPPFVLWYLSQVCTYQQQHGVRLVDYLDLHYYPQDPNGDNVPRIDSNADDATTRGRRLRSMKELYDPTWTSEAWIGTLTGFPDQATWNYTNPDLIPRIRAWIDQYCPGTKLAITEYNWGDDTLDSATLAQAEVLAIYAREGVDLATRWVAPDPGSKAERAFKIFLNYDGAGAKVQGDSISAVSGTVDQIGAYAFHGNGNTYVLLTNKDSVGHDVNVTFDKAHNATWTLYGFDGSNALRQITSHAISSNTVTITGLPTLSVRLLVVPDDQEIFKNGFD